MSVGQEFTNAKRVVVLIEGQDGLEHGWEVFNPRQVDWEFYGIIGGSSHATMTVSGEFHRMTRYGANGAFESGTLELEE